ncbi:hypothetical protein GDO86_013439 [Hymenochirus boettgeri]|uniref:FHA domain-containing protein n=1 Tax=Hymenochirus boettgeri TaxID=247094 RepID=A0A8T2IYI3_9PIPI|nr:hypothetical protein GDO86_013439 [Hymenochirus boettgeri]
MPLFGKIVVIKRNGSDGTHFPLTASTCMFGRKTECDIRIQLPHVSKEHCKVEVRENKEVYVTNLSAVNPTQLNGKDINQPERLHHGDVLTIIDRSFRFEEARLHPARRRSTGENAKSNKWLEDEQSSDKGKASKLTRKSEGNVTKTSNASQSPHRGSSRERKDLSPFSELYEMFKNKVHSGQERAKSPGKLQAKNTTSPVASKKSNGNNPDSPKSPKSQLDATTPAEKALKSPQRGRQSSKNEQENQNDSDSGITRQDGRGKQSPRKSASKQPSENSVGDSKGNQSERRKSREMVRTPVKSDIKVHASNGSLSPQSKKTSPRRTPAKPHLKPEEKAVSKPLAKRRSSELELPEPPSKRKRVSFGGHLSPELFDKRLPPNSPLKRGATPARRSLSISTPYAVMRKSFGGFRHTAIKSPAKETPEKRSPHQKSPSSGKLSLGKATPSKQTPGKASPDKQSLAKFTPAKRSPGKTSPVKCSPGKSSPAKQSPAKFTPAKRSPGKASPAKRSPGKASPAKRSPGKASPAKRSPGKASLPSGPQARPPCKRSPGKASPAKRSPGRPPLPSGHGHKPRLPTVRQEHAAKRSRPKPRLPSGPAKATPAKRSRPKPRLPSGPRPKPACQAVPRPKPLPSGPGQATPAKRSPAKASPAKRSPAKATPAKRSPAKATPAKRKSPLKIAPASFYTKGRFSISRIDTPPEITASVSNIGMQTPKKSRKSALLKKTPVRRSRKLEAFETLRSGEGVAYNFFFSVAKSWADVVRIGVAKSQKKSVKNRNAHKTHGKRKPKPKTPARIMKELTSTGHADSPATILVGRAHTRTVNLTGYVPKVMKNQALKITADQNESLTGLKELFTTPVNGKRRKSGRLEGLSVDSPKSVVVNMSVMQTPEEIGEMVVSPINNSPPSTYKNQYSRDAVSRLLKNPVDLEKDSTESLSGNVTLKPYNNKRKSFGLTGVKRIMRTPKQKGEQVVDPVAIKKMLRTPKVVETLPVTNTKRLSDINNLVGVKRILKTPKQKGQPVEDFAGIGRIMKTPKLKEKPVEDMVGIKRIMSTPKEKGQPVEDMAGIKRIMRSPKVKGQPVEDMVGIKRIMRTPKMKGQPLEDLDGVSQIMSTPTENTRPIEEIFGMKQLIKTPPKKKAHCVTESIQNVSALKVYFHRKYVLGTSLTHAFFLHVLKLHTSIKRAVIQLHPPLGKAVTKCLSESGRRLSGPFLNQSTKTFSSEAVEVLGGKIVRRGRPSKNQASSSSSIEGTEKSPKRLGTSVQFSNEQNPEVNSQKSPLEKTITLSSEIVQTVSKKRGRPSRNSLSGSLDAVNPGAVKSPERNSSPALLTHKQNPEETPEEQNDSLENSLELSKVRKTGRGRKKGEEAKPLADVEVITATVEESAEKETNKLSASKTSTRSARPRIQTPEKSLAVASKKTRGRQPKTAGQENAIQLQEKIVVGKLQTELQEENSFANVESLSVRRGTRARGNNANSSLEIVTVEDALSAQNTHVHEQTPGSQSAKIRRGRKKLDTVSAAVESIKDSGKTDAVVPKAKDIKGKRSTRAKGGPQVEEPGSGIDADLKGKKSRVDSTEQPLPESGTVSAEENVVKVRSSRVKSVQWHPLLTVKENSEMVANDNVTNTSVPGIKRGIKSRQAIKESTVTVKRSRQEKSVETGSVTIQEVTEIDSLPLVDKPIGTPKTKRGRRQANMQLEKIAIPELLEGEIKTGGAEIVSSDLGMEVKSKAPNRKNTSKQNKKSLSDSIQSDTSIQLIDPVEDHITQKRGRRATRMDITNVVKNSEAAENVIPTKTRGKASSQTTLQTQSSNLPFEPPSKTVDQATILIESSEMANGSSRSKRGLKRKAGVVDFSDVLSKTEPSPAAVKKGTRGSTRQKSEKDIVNEKPMNAEVSPAKRLKKETTPNGKQKVGKPKAVVSRKENVKAIEAVKTRPSLRSRK